MKYAIHPIDDVLLVDVTSPCVPDPRAANLHDEIRRRIAAGARRFLIDMQGCKFTTSGGIGVLAAILTTVGHAGGEIRLCNVNPRVETVLEITHLRPLLVIDATRAESMQAMGIDRPRDRKPA